jgi:MFS family permease
MDQRIFILARGPAMVSLLPPGATPAEITYYSGVATAVFMLGWAIGGFCFGVLGDRWGRAKTMMLTVLLYSAFTGLSALSQGLWDFSLYRFLTGLGVGGEFAAGVTLVAEVMPASARPHALGVLQAFGAVGNIIGSLLSFVVLPLGWRWMFVVGVLPALLVAAVFRKMAEPEAWRRARAPGGRRIKGRSCPICSSIRAGDEIRWSGCCWPYPEWWGYGASACGFGADAGNAN